MIGAASAQTVLRSSDTHPDGYPTVEAVKYFGELVKERTDGRYRSRSITRPSSARRRTRSSRRGPACIDLNRVSHGAVQRHVVPETIVPSLPYIFRSDEHMHKVMDGPIGDEILAAFEPHGLVVPRLLRWRRALVLQHRRSRSTPIADMKGMKFRVIQSDIFVDMVAALGANATPMPYGEVYSAHRDRRHRRRRKQLPELRHRQAFRGREVLLARRAPDRAGSPRDVEDRAGTS